MQAIPGSALDTAWLHDLVFVYQTDYRLIIVTRREGYVSWGVSNIFLTPAPYWIYDCIQDWSQEWDPALNTSKV